MISLKDAINKLQNEGVTFSETKRKSRNDWIKEIYEFYLKDKKNLDINQYKRWLLRNKKRHSLSNAEHWKTSSKEWRKPITDKSFASFWLSHIPTSDLPYISSIARDKLNRGESFNKWLFWAIKSDR